MARSSGGGVKKQQQQPGQPEAGSSLLESQCAVMPTDMSMEACALGIGMGSIESISSNRSGSASSTVTSNSSGSRGGASARIAHDAQTVKLSSPRHSSQQTYKTTTSRSVTGRLWTSEQDEALREGVLRLGGSSTTSPDSWVSVGEHMTSSGGFSVEDCRVRWSEIKDQAVKGPWSPHEDALLCTLVNKFGPKPKKWSYIASHIPGRAGKQCRERWLNHLDTTVKKGEWTEDEDRILCEAQRQIGNKWSEIARLLPGRAENSVKNRFNSLITRRMARAGGKPGAEGELSPSMTPSPPDLIDPLYLALPKPVPAFKAELFVGSPATKPGGSAKGGRSKAKARKPAAKARGSKHTPAAVEAVAAMDAPLPPPPASTHEEAVELLSDTEIDTLLDSLESSTPGGGGASMLAFLSESYPLEPTPTNTSMANSSSGSRASSACLPFSATAPLPPPPLPPTPLAFTSSYSMLSPPLPPPHMARPGLLGSTGNGAAPLLLPPGLMLSLGHTNQLQHQPLPQHMLCLPPPPPPPSFPPTVLNHTPSIIRQSSSKQPTGAAKRKGGSGRINASQQQAKHVSMVPPDPVGSLMLLDHPQALPADLSLPSSSASASSASPSSSSASTQLPHHHHHHPSFYGMSLSMGSEEWSLIEPLISDHDGVPGLTSLADSFYSSASSSAPGGSSLDGSLSSGLSQLLPDSFADLGLDCFSLPPRQHHHQNSSSNTQQESGSHVAKHDNNNNSNNFTAGSPSSDMMISNKRSHGVMMKGADEAMMSSSGSSSQMALPSFESLEGGIGESSSKRVK